MQPNGEWTIRHITKPAMTKQAKAVVVERTGEKLDLVVPAEFQAEDLHSRHAHAAVTAGEVVKFEQEGVEQHAERQREHAEKDSDVSTHSHPIGSAIAADASMTATNTSSNDLTPNRRHHGGAVRTKAKNIA